MALAGICTGCAMLLRLPDDKARALVSYFSESAANGETATFAKVFKSCLLINMKYVMLYFLMSLTVYSSWLCPTVSGYKGFSVGFTSAFLIKNYGAHGVAYFMLAIIPAAVLAVPVHLFTSVVCINFAAGRRKRSEVGARAALGIVPALVIIYTVMVLCSLYDVIIAPVIFRNLF